MEEKIKNLIKKIDHNISFAELFIGRTFYVGGCVRDKIMGIESKDIDVEIHDIREKTVVNILSKYGEVNEIGRNFGIYQIKGFDINFSLPRYETNTGCKHNELQVIIDPYMPYKRACLRRDFTMNAIMEDVRTGEIIDPLNGLKDIENKIIRHVDSNTFIEDPLRGLRMCQFAGRLGFTPTLETFKLVHELDYSHLPKERIFEELKKGLLKSPKPSWFFEVMQMSGIIKKLFPALLDIIHCDQDPRWHSEGMIYSNKAEYIDLEVIEIALLEKEVEVNIAGGNAEYYSRLGDLRSQPVIQFTMDGELVAFHSSIREASKAVGKNYSNEIAKCCKGEKDSVYNYKWIFKKDFKEEWVVKKGSVWTHTLMVLDELAKIKDKSEDPLALMFAGLLHDIGKPLTRKVSENGKVTFNAHERIGSFLASKFMLSLTNDKKLHDKVIKLVENHMRPNNIVFTGSDKAVRRLMVNTDIHEQLLLSEADYLGRKSNVEPTPLTYDKHREWFLRKIESLKTSDDGKIKSLVTGKDLIKLGLKPGPRFKEMLDYAMNLQLEGEASKQVILHHIIMEFDFNMSEINYD